MIAIIIIIGIAIQIGNTVAISVAISKYSAASDQEEISSI